MKSYGKDKLEDEQFADLIEIWRIVLGNRGVPIELIEPTAVWFLSYGIDLPVPSEFADKALELKPDYFVQVWIDVLEGGEEKMACLEFHKARWEVWSESQRQLAIANHPAMRELVVRQTKSIKGLRATDRGKKFLAKLGEEPPNPVRTKKSNPTAAFHDPTEEEVAEANRTRSKQIHSLKQEASVS